MLKRTPLARKSKSEKAQRRDRIQALLRAIGIKRDGGCFLRNYSEAGACDQILQWDHLNSRAYSVSFGDSRLGVCVCRRHHIYWKPQHSARYEICARDFIGTKRVVLLDRVREDRGVHKMDWKIVELSLEEELNNMKK